MVTNEIEVDGMADDFIATLSTSGTRTVEIRFTDRWSSPCSRTVSW